MSHQVLRRFTMSSSTSFTRRACSTRFWSPPTLSTTSFIFCSTWSRKALSTSRTFMAVRKSPACSVDKVWRRMKYSCTSRHCWCNTFTSMSEAPDWLTLLDLLRSFTISRRRWKRSRCLRRSASCARMLCFSLSVSARWSSSVMRVFLLAWTNSSTSASCSSSFLRSAPALGAIKIRKDTSSCRSRSEVPCCWSCCNCLRLWACRRSQLSRLWTKASMSRWMSMMSRSS
mmetsp:Transcript_1776/g.4148  ORF Transcript_1776/g.4148 Transcript_1776/m.4148 type:complete len:229 (-) Transcript_1776:714-1400(-)